MHVARVALLPHEEAVVIDEGHRAVVHPLDILLGPLLVDDALGAVGLAEHHLEGVLASVEAVVPEAAVGREAQARDVLVGLAARVDAVLGPGLKVGDPELQRRVLLPGLGVFERVGLVIELAVEAHHLHQGHLRLVEAQVGQPLAVGREGVGAREAELLLVDPVGRAVDDRVPRSVVGDPASLLRGDLIDVEVVAVRIGDQPPVGREGGVARGLGLGEDRADDAVGRQQVLRRVGVAVDGRAARSDEDHPFVGREGVVRDGLHVAAPGQQTLARPLLCIAVTQDLVAFEGRIVFAVGHRADAVHPLVHRCQTGYFAVFVAGRKGPGAEQGGRQDGNESLFHGSIRGIRCLRR